MISLRSWFSPYQICHHHISGYLYLYADIPYQMSVLHNTATFFLGCIAALEMDGVRLEDI